MRNKKNNSKALEKKRSSRYTVFVVVFVLRCETGKAKKNTKHSAQKIHRNKQADATKSNATHACRNTVKLEFSLQLLKHSSEDKYAQL